MPLLVELAPFQREFGKMSDSDDDECCPELVEEDLSKVGNYNFYVFLEEYVFVVHYPKAKDFALILKYVPLMTFW